MVFGRRSRISTALHKFNWLIRPSILNLIYEVLAMAHRRNGTWA